MEFNSNVGSPWTLVGASGWIRKIFNFIFRPYYKRSSIDKDVYGFGINYVSKMTKKASPTSQKGKVSKLLKYLAPESYGDMGDYLSSGSHFWDVELRETPQEKESRMCCFIDSTEQLSFLGSVKDKQMGSRFHTRQTRAVCQPTLLTTPHQHADHHYFKCNSHESNGLNYLKLNPTAPINSYLISKGEW